MREYTRVMRYLVVIVKHQYVVVVVIFVALPRRSFVLCLRSPAVNVSRDALRPSVRSAFVIFSE